MNKKKNSLNKIPVSDFQSVSSKLPTTKVQNQKVIFSFERFKCISIKNKQFNNCFASINAYVKWSTLLFQRLQKFSENTVPELKKAGTSTRCHSVTGNTLIKLKDILKESGLDIDINEQLEEYWELSLGTSSGRIFGYFISNVYYIILFDPHHLIYPKLEYGAQHDLLYNNYDPWNEIS